MLNILEKKTNSQVFTYNSNNIKSLKNDTEIKEINKGSIIKLDKKEYDNLIYYPSSSKE